MSRFPFIGRLLLIPLGIVIAAVLVWGLVSAFPQLLPPELRDPLERRAANQTIQVRYTDLDGDLFFHLKGQVKPPQNPQVYAEYTLRTDENGFRIPQMALDDYADYKIVALGDSFTDAWMVERTWVDVLAQELNTPVLNLAYRGYGTLEEAEVMRQYGRGNREWVLLAFFEGNDLQNIAQTYRGEGGGSLLTNLVREAIAPDKFEIVESPDGNYRYPLALYIGADFYELAFYDSYIWILNAPRQLYANSRNLAVFKEALNDILEASGGACVGVIYIPTKAHIYFQYTEPFGRRWILDYGQEPRLDDEGWIAEGETQPIAFETLLSRMDNQRDAMQAAVEATSAYFIDLVPPFQDAAAQSQMLYFTYDTHWNQAGQELAGRTVAAALNNIAACGFADE